MKKGFTLLFGVLLMSLLLALAFSIMSLSTKHLIISSVGRESQVAFYAADSGLECVKYWDQQGREAFSTTSPKTAIECFGNNNIAVTDVTSIASDVTSCPTFGGNCVPCSDLSGGYCKKYKVGFSLLNGVTGAPDGDVYVEKNILSDLTVIDSYGHNTETSGPRRLERAVKLTYTPVKKSLPGLCGYLDIVFLLDTSGSLLDYTSPSDPNTDGFDILKAASIATVTKIKDRTDADVHISLMGFKGYDNLEPGDSTVNVKTRLEDVDGNGYSKQDLIDAINSLSSYHGSGTDTVDPLYYGLFELSNKVLPGTFMTSPLPNPIAAYVDSAADHTRDREDVQFPDAIVLITDGEPNNYVDVDGADAGTRKYSTSNGLPKSQALTIANEIKSRYGIDLFVIGIGVDSPSQTSFLNSIASNGKYFESTFEDAPPQEGINSLLSRLSSCPVE